MSSFLSKRLALAVISIISAPVGAATVFEVNTFQDGADISQGGTCATATGACSLRAAIQEANFQTSTGPHTIKLPAGTYNLSLQGSDDGAAMGDLDINSSMTIEGFGADKTIIQLASSVVNTEYRIFHIVATSGSPTVTIKGVTIKGGMSSLGAGIYLQTGTLNLNDSQVDSNNANQGTVALGGGIYSNGTLKLVGTTISNNNVLNNTSGQGGGIYVSAQATTTYITNSTISTNTVSGSQGGGIYNASPGTFVIASSTITQNAVNASGTGGSGIFNAATSANVRLKNTILAQNRANSGSSIPDCAGPLASDGYNLVGFAASGGVCTFSSGTGDQVGPVSGAALNASLATASALNGGTVLNYLPNLGSLAIETGSPSGCTSAENVALTTDQRGYVRASLNTGATPGLQGRCDIGAIEANSSYGLGIAPTASLAFTAYSNTSASGSLASANPSVSLTAPQTAFTQLTYTKDPSVTPRGTVSINPRTGYFNYSPPNGETGTDTFRYIAENGSQRETGLVTITIVNSSSSSLNPPVGPASISVVAQPGSKLRGTVAIVDPDASDLKFTTTKIGADPSRGTVTVYADSESSAYYEYTPTGTGQDTFQLNVSSSGLSTTVTVNVNIGNGGVIPASAPVMLGSLIRDDASRTQQTVLSLSDFAPALRNPSSLSVTLAKFLDPLSATGGSLGTLQYASNTFTFTPPTGGVSSSENRAIFRVNGTYIDSGVTKNLADVPVTLNFAVAGASGVPVPNQYSSLATVPRTGGGTFSSATASPLLSNITLPSGATSIIFEVSNSASGTFGNSASSSLGRVDVSTPSNGAFLYTVTSGTAVMANQDTFYYRVRYTDSLGNPVTTTSAALVLNFIGAAAAPAATAIVVNAVPRTGTYSSSVLQNLSYAVTPLPAGTYSFEVFSNASSWAATVTGQYGTLAITNTTTGAFTYTASSVGTATQEAFQYRLRYTDSGGGIQYVPANLLLNFLTAGVPSPISNSGYHAIPGDTITIPLKYVTSAGNANTPVPLTQYFITKLPNKGKLFMADSSGMEITPSSMASPMTQAQVKYVANAGATGSDTFNFKVKEPVSGGTFLDSTPAEITVDIGHGLASVSTPLEEGGGGALSPLALLAMLALYGRRRFH